MSTFESKQRETYRSEIESELKELSGYDRMDKETIKKVLDHLCGTYEYRSDSEYKVVNRYRKYDKVTFLQRINKLWVYPALLLLVCPVKWLATGDFGFKTDSRFGDILTKLIGDNW